MPDTHLLPPPQQPQHDQQFRQQRERHLREQDEKRGGQEKDAYGLKKTAWTPAATEGREEGDAAED